MDKNNTKHDLLKLPFDPSASVRYLESPAYVLGIFKALGLEDRLTLPFFIQIAASWPGDVGDVIKFHFVPHMYLENWGKAGIIEIEELSKTFFDITSKDCHDIVIDRLRKFRYMVVELDAFYLSFKTDYQQRHFIHKVLIFGVNCAGKHFYVAGYGTQDWGEHCISFDEFDRALAASRDKLKNENIRLACSIMPKEESVRREPDISQIITNLKGYLQGEVTDSDRVWQAPRTNRSYGINARAEYRSYLNDLQHDFKKADRRKTRLLLEHSILMKERLRFTGKEIGSSKTEEADKLMETCIQNCRSLHYAVSLLRTGRLTNFNVEKQMVSLDRIFRNCEAAINCIITN